MQKYKNNMFMWGLPCEWINQILLGLTWADSHRHYVNSVSWDPQNREDPRRTREELKKNPRRPGPIIRKPGPFRRKPGPMSKTRIPFVCIFMKLFVVQLSTSFPTNINTFPMEINQFARTRCQLFFHFQTP